VGFSPHYYKHSAKIILIYPDNIGKPFGGMKKHIPPYELMLRRDAISRQQLILLMIQRKNMAG
jgi:hypothetical protein